MKSQILGFFLLAHTDHLNVLYYTPEIAEISYLVVLENCIIKSGYRLFGVAQNFSGSRISLATLGSLTLCLSRASHMTHTGRLSDNIKQRLDRQRVKQTSIPTASNKVE